MEEQKKGIIMLKKTIAFTCLALSMAATAANADTISYTDSGWWDDTGFSTDASFSNYVAGTWTCTPEYDCDPAREVLTRNFFVFDLAGVGIIDSATLRLSTATSVGGPYEIWDVLSTIPELRAPGDGTDPSVYNDLGMGESYGSYIVPTTPLPGDIIEILLTQAAIDSINAKDGCISTPGSVDCLWAIGGSFDPATFVFGNSGSPANGGGVRELVTSVVPVPAAAWLFGSALLGLVALKRKKA
jgi:hypothetical protein